MTNEELKAIHKRAEGAKKGATPEWHVDDEHRDVIRCSWSGDLIAQCVPTEADATFIAHAREDVPNLLAEIERLRRELSFIANVDLMKNAYNAEHIAVSVQSWALNVLDGVNHDDEEA